MTTFKANERAEEAAPRWAVLFLSHVSDDYNNANIPPLHWKQNSNPAEWSSRGHYRYSFSPTNRNVLEDHYIHVTAGTDILDQIQVVVHEAAHWIAGHTHGHDWHYWSTYWDFVTRYELPFYYCYYRSARYKSLSESVARSRWKIKPMIDVQARLYELGDEVFRPEPFYNGWEPKEYPWRMLCKIRLGRASNPAPSLAIRSAVVTNDSH